MNTKLIGALELSLQVLEHGGTVEECLSRFPSLALDLRPLLESALSARSISLPTIPGNAVTRGRVRVLNRAAQLRQGLRPRAHYPRAWRLAAIPLVVLAFLFLTGNGLIAASANALPGDALYPFKRTVEDIRLRLAPNLNVKAGIQKEISTRRIDETEILLSEQHVEPVDFEGQVSEQLPDGWLIAGIPVRVTLQTEVEGTLAIGAQVEVRGLTQSDGSVLAERVTVETSDSGNDDDHSGSSGSGDKTPEPMKTDDDSSESGSDGGDKTPEPVKTDDDSSESGSDGGDKTPEPTKIDDSSSGSESGVGDDHAGSGESTPEPSEKDDD